MPARDYEHSGSTIVEPERGYGLSFGPEETRLAPQLNTLYIPAPRGCRTPRCQGATLVNGPQEFLRRVRGESRPCLAEGRRLHCRFQGVFDSFIGPEMTRHDCQR